MRNAGDRIGIDSGFEDDGVLGGTPNKYKVGSWNWNLRLEM
jgi:hypothetical protein